MDDFLLIAAAFLSASLTAVLGLGGGMLLISIMSVFLPPAAVVPIHGVVQFASNASRGAFSPKDIRRDILWPFLAGCLLGTLIGSRVVLNIPTDFLPIPLGFFCPGNDLAAADQKEALVSRRILKSRFRAGVSDPFRRRHRATQHALPGTCRLEP